MQVLSSAFACAVEVTVGPEDDVPDPELQAESQKVWMLMGVLCYADRAMSFLAS
jgi:hypothetical protein